VYSFRDITRFATVYYADRLHSSVRNYVTCQIACLPRRAVADVSIVVVPFKCARDINNNRIIVNYSENSV